MIANPVKLLIGATAFAVLILALGCAHVPLRARQDFRRQQFFAMHREVSPDVAEAIKKGHIIVGMNTEEVWVIAGDPLRTLTYRVGNVEVRLYPAVRFHQGPGTHTTLFRLVFIDGRLRVIEPI